MKNCNHPNVGTYLGIESKKFQSYVVPPFERRMVPKDMLVLAVIYFILINSGETFTRPRPIEFSNKFGFKSLLKTMFGIVTNQERNEIYEQLEPLRKKLKCARMAKDLNKPWIEEYCLNGLQLSNKNPPTSHQNWNFGF